LGQRISNYLQLIESITFSAPRSIAPENNPAELAGINV
jgi:hypothetical protein